MRAWLRSVRFAMQGLAFAYRNERNMRIHVRLALAALCLVAALDVPLVQGILVLLAIVLVMVTELINTALEKTIDSTGVKPHPLAKAAKDCAAAAVLLCAAFAVTVGIAVFLPLIWEGPAWRWK